MPASHPPRSPQWTRERIDALSTAEVRQLRENAARLNEVEITALCDQVLVGRPKKKGARKPKT